MTESTSSEKKDIRNWVGISTTASKKDMDKIDMSTADNSTINIDQAKDQYLGGDDEELEGFYDSEDEIEFENFKNKGNKKASGGLFARLTSSI